MKAANDKLKELDTKLADAASKVQAKSFPDDLSTVLGGLTIPFEAINLDNKGVNGMTTNLFRMVLNYNAACKNLNKARESLKNLVGLAKEPLTKAWKEETDPRRQLQRRLPLRRRQGPSASLVPTVSPFEWKKDFPEKYKISKQEGRADGREGGQALPEGRPPRRRPHRHPGRPQEHRRPHQRRDVQRRLAKALGDMRIELKGNKEDPTTARRACSRAATTSPSS